MPGNNKKHNLDEKKTEKQKATKRRRVSRETDRSLQTTLESFLSVLKVDDAKVDWTKSAVVNRLHEGADFPTHAKGAALRDFSSVPGFPENYAFAIYSQRTAYPTKLRQVMQGLTPAQQSQFSLNYFNVKFPERDQYQAHVFYLRCEELTQNAQRLWMQLCGKAAAESEIDSVASTPSSRASTPPTAAAAAAAASTASAANDENNVAGAGLTTAEIYARLQSVTASAAREAAAIAAIPAEFAVVGEGVAPASTPVVAPFDLLANGDHTELYPFGYQLAQANRRELAVSVPVAGDADVGDTLLVASPTPASPLQALTAAASPSNLLAGLFGRISPPPVTAPVGSPLTPTFGLGSADN